MTFIFSVYLTDSVGKNIDSSITPSSWFGFIIALSGVFIALVAPVMGQRADAKGKRRQSMAVWTAITCALMLSLFVVRNDAPVYFWLGCVIMGVASVTFQFAEVSYFAQINQVSTKANVGRVSGFGWSLGYFGGIVLLLLSYVGFIAGGDELHAGALGVSTDAGLNIRLVAVVAALWFFFLALPVVWRVPEIPAHPNLEATGMKASYVRLWQTLRDLWRNERNSLMFLVSSAVFRDGLAGVFTFGAIIAVSVYGFSAGQVLIFGVVANVVSALGALISGLFDDHFGPKPVIMVSLLAMIVCCGILFFVEGPKNFWIFGLALCLFVGPAQSASRTFLARLARDGQEGQLFGLYVTTGRAVSWMAPAAFSLAVAISGADRSGIIGIGLVLALGLVLLVKVSQPALAHEDALG